MTDSDLAPTEIFQTFPDGIFVTDKSFVYKAWNPAMEKISGFRAAEVVGQNAFVRFPFLKEIGEEKFFQQALQGETILSENRAFIVPETGKKGHFEGVYAPFRSARGEIIGIIVSIRDVTKRIDRMVQLQAVTESLSHAVTSEQVAEIIVDQGMKATGAWSASMCEICEDKEHMEIVVSRGMQQSNEERWQVFPLSCGAPLAIAATEKRPVYIHDLSEAEEEFPNIAVTMRKYRHEALAAIPLVIEGTVIGGISLSFDSPKAFLADETDFLQTLAGQCAHAYERSRVYRKEKEARAAAEGANAAKTRFLANVSHETRTPLTAIMGFAELLQKPRPEEQRQSFLAGIIRNCNSLMSIVDDILDIAKIEAGRLRITREPVPIASLLHEVLGIGRQLAGGKDIALGYEIDRNVPELVNTDPNRLKQVLLNVISNAAKFTEKGRVDINVHLIQEEACKPCISFSIEDTGLGINAEDQRFLFEPFQQGRSKATVRFVGSGLGLAFSRRLARAMGGDIKLVSSLPGKGTVFAVTVPLEEVDPQLKELPGPTKTHPRQGQRLAGKAILVAEDQEDILELLNVMLTSEGAEVTLARDGAEALAHAARSPFDLVLMDLQMPVIDGYEAVEKLRASGFAKPILALSAHVLEEHRARTLKAGFDAHVAKPVESERLVSLLELALRK